MDLLSQIDLTNTPEHIAIIMDGNGRWAKKHGQERLYGHNFGVDSVKNTVMAAKDLGVKYVTFYTFSTENWNRPKEEVDGLMSLMVTAIAREVNEMAEKGVCLKTIGDIDGLPEDCQEELKSAMQTTAANQDIHMVLALNYSSRWEIKEATKKIGTKIASGELKAEEVNDDVMDAHLSTKGIPDPELLIRTSGELRISNFLLWQIAYAELHFTPVLWPDFNRDDLFKAVLDFQNRERRFGMVSEQIQK